MTDKRFILLLILCSLTLAAYSQKSRPLWDNSKQVFESPEYNLRWDLSGLGEWKVGLSLPSHMLFCAALDDISVSLLAIENEDNVPLNEGAEEFIDGFLYPFLNHTLNGISHEAIHYERYDYIFRDALKVGILANITDARLGTNEPVPFIYGCYVFEKDGMIIIPCILIPFDYVDKYGDDIVEMFFDRLSYIDASKELNLK